MAKRYRLVRRFIILDFYQTAPSLIAALAGAAFALGIVIGSLPIAKKTRKSRPKRDSPNLATLNKLRATTSPKV
jgi:hypothetical protein